MVVLTQNLPSLGGSCRLASSRGGSGARGHVLHQSPRAGCGAEARTLEPVESARCRCLGRCRPGAGRKHVIWMEEGIGDEGRHDAVVSLVTSVLQEPGAAEAQGGDEGPQRCIPQALGLHLKPMEPPLPDRCLRRVLPEGDLLGSAVVA